MSNASDFIIKNGVLTEYVGPGGDVTVPEGVTSIGNGVFSYCSSLTGITIPDGVTSIGYGAFEWCHSLTSIVIPDSVTSIGDWAFSGCSSLTSIALPDGLTGIVNGTFENCSSLTSITLPDGVTSIGDDAFIGCKGLSDAEGFIVLKGILYDYCGTSEKVVIPDDVTGIGKSAFKNCQGLQSVTILDSVTSIGNEAFYDCRSLTSIVISDGVTGIGGRAFYNCSSLTSITIPDGVTSIGDSAFSGCRSLTSITLPDSVTSIGYGAFEDCSSLQSITIPNSVTSIGDWAFYRCESLTSITLPDGVTSIGNRAFKDCRSLISITLPDGVTSIGEEAFCWCKNLRHITILSNVTSIGNEAFSACGRLKRAVILDGVTSIGDKMFRHCESLQSVVIPDSVTSIGKEAFGGCPALQSLRLPADVELGTGVFGNVLPRGLLPQVSALWKLMTDGALKQYILSDDQAWNNLTTKERRELVSLRQSKMLLPAYRERITAEDADIICGTLTQRLTEESTAKECTSAVNFLTIFPGIVSAEKLRELYEKLKTLKAAKKAVATVKKDAHLMSVLQKETIPAAGDLASELLPKIGMTRSVLSIKLKGFYGLAVKDLPKLHFADGSEVPDELTIYLLVAHEKASDSEYEDEDVVAAWEKPGLCPVAEEVVTALNKDELLAALRDLADTYLDFQGVNKKRYLAFPLCRYADEAFMEELTRKASAAYRKTHPFNVFCGAALYSDTAAAMFFADKFKNLEAYATVRGVAEDTIRDHRMALAGLDEHGCKQYDLGGQTVTVRLQPDLSFIVELENGKTAKSLPKKDVDPVKYEEAKVNFSRIKKNAKLVIQNRGVRLFDDFVTGNSRSAEDWQGVYLNNLLLRSVAKRIVWSQGKNTFTMTDDGAVCSDGGPYALTDEAICVAHPMELAASDVSAWQEYFRSHSIKQPFEQIWERVIDPDEVMTDRYKGCQIDPLYLKKQEKRGINCWESWGGYYDVSLYIEGFDVDIKVGTGGAGTIEISYLHPQNWDRRANTVISFLDRITTRERIRKDDISVMELMQRYNAAQITDFLNTAIENKAVNLTAALLSYKQEHFPEYDAFSEFTLE